MNIQNNSVTISASKSISKRWVASLCLWIYFVFALILISIPYRGVIMTALIIVAYLSMLSYKKVYIFKYSINRYLLPLFFLPIIPNIFIESDITTHFVYAIQYSLLVLTMTQYCVDKKTTSQLVKIIFWPVFISGPIIGLIQLITGRYMFYSGNEDVFISTIISDAKHSNANYAALTMILSLILAVYLFIKTKKYIYLLSSIVSAVCVVLTFSRTAIFATVLCGIWALAEYIFRKASMKIKTKQLIFFFVSIIVFIILYNSIWSSVEDYFVRDDLIKLWEIKQTSTLNIRTNQWLGAIKATMNNGIFHFFFGFGDVANTYLASYSGYNMSAHNLWFGYLVETGIFGFILSIAIYIKSIVNFIRFRKLFEFYELWIYIGTFSILMVYMAISILTWELIVAITIMNIIVIGNHKEREISR